MKKLEIIELSDERDDVANPPVRDFAPSPAWLGGPCAQLLSEANNPVPTILMIWDFKMAIAEYRAGRLQIPKTVRFVCYA